MKNHEKCYTQAILAEQLGMSTERVRQLKKQGMPVHSLQAAQAWREVHQNIAARKPLPRAQPSNVNPDPAATTKPTLAAQSVTAQMVFAEDVLRGGKSIDDFLPMIRVAMAAVPPAQRDQVELSLPVMRVLLAPILTWLGSPNDNPTFKDGTPIFCDGSTMTDSEAQEVGEDWYRLACGEIPWTTPQGGP